MFQATFFQIENPNAHDPKGIKKYRRLAPAAFNGPTIDLSDCFTGGNPANSTTYSDERPDEIFKRVNGAFAGNENLFLVETNCAHQMSYYLATAAFAQAARKGMLPAKQLVLNYDQHFDYGRGCRNSTEPRSCGNWGCYLAANINYCVLGLGEQTSLVNKTPGNTFFSVEANLVNALSSISLTDTEPLENFLIYVTVDMDVLICDSLRRTNWPQGNSKLEELLGAIKQLPEQRVIAADITGFPPIDKSDPESGIIYEKYLSDIAKIGEELSSKII